MLSLKKTPGRDLTVLNLTDPQLGTDEWKPGHPNGAILTGTVRELVRRVRPDLITVSGDLSWAGHDAAYDALADLLDSFSVPWAPVWGNHDDQGGPEQVESVVTRYLRRPLCLYERGPRELGNGNYVIRIEEDGRPVTALVMMDSHDRSPFTAAAGKETLAWARLSPEQIAWYREQIRALAADGCRDSAMILHIPIYAYRTAFAAAFRDGLDPKSVSVAQSADGSVWNEGYRDSFGVLWEEICSYPAEDHVFDAIRALGSTKYVLAGHDHVNDTVIRYHGVRLVYSLKTGPGCYWDPRLNGGTVLRITSEGIADVRHEYVDPSPWMPQGS